jgi:hypothetical protein
VSSLYQLGLALKALGRTEDAKAAFLELEHHVRARPAADCSSQCELGLARLAMGDLSGAERAFRRAVNAGAWWARVHLDKVRRQRSAASEGTQPADRSA